MGDSRAALTLREAISVDCYGSLGNLVLQSPPGVQVANNYDFAARVTATRSNEIGPTLTNPCIGQAVPSGGRMYVSNTYNNSTPGNSYGRLTSRVGSSFFVPGVGTSYDVTDSFVYNGVGARVSSETTTVGGSGVSTTQSWMYNGLGLLAHHYHARSSGAPFVLSWGYDAGLPVKGYVNGIPMVKTVTYAPSGALTAYTTGLGIGTDVTTAIAQDAQLLPRPASITTSGATLNFATGGYTYDGAGNIKAMGVDSFDYDLRSRLLSATLSNPQGGTVSQSMGYDRYGNLLTKGATTYSVNATNNRLTTATYDARGNVTVNGGDTYAYDGLDRMEYNRTASSEWDYVYDAAGERIAKIPPFGAPWTHTFRDEGKRVSTEYAGTTPSRDNVYLGSLLVASYANGSVGGNGPVWTYYASDHLGTPRLITDPGGTVVEQRKTYPYGEDLGTQGVFQRVKFAAMERDVEGASSGTGGSRHHDHARSQEFNLGRFLSPDKLQGRIRNPQSWNRYAYALSNPLKFLDPDGQAAVGFIGLGNKPGGITRIVSQINGTPGVGEARAFRHQDVKQAVAFLAAEHKAHPDDAVVVVGHSLGAESALNAARELGKQGIKVDLAITIDPVRNNVTVPPNASQVQNYYETKDTFLPGKTVSPESASTQVSNIEVLGVNKHTDIDDVMENTSAVANQVREVGMQHLPPTCGNSNFVGPCQ